MSRLLNRRNIIILLVVLVVMVGVYLLVHKPPLPEGLIQVNGRIEGDVVVISSKYNGKIMHLLAREGDSVKKGEVVVRLDDPETRARLAQAQHDLNVMIAQAQAAGQNVGLTSETGGSVIDQAKGQVMQAESDIEDTQASARSAAANVGNAEAAVSSYAATKRQALEAIDGSSAQVDVFKSKLQAMEKEVVASRAQAKESALNARRFSNLADEGVVTERQRDEYVTHAEKDQAHLQAVIAEVDSIKAQIVTKQSDLRQSKNQYAAAAADLQRAQAQLAAARQDESAAKARVLTAKAKLAQNEGILRQALTAPTQVAISKSNHAGAQAQIKEARAKVDEQASTLRNLFVVAPITGMIVTRIRDHGEVVTAGSPILEVVNLDRLYLKAYVPENQIGQVRLGLHAKIYVDAYPGKPFNATVRYISSTAEFTPKEVQTPDERVKLVYATKLYLDKNPGHRMTPGMPADAIIRWKEGVGWEKPRY